MKVQFRAFIVAEYEKTCTLCGGYGTQRGETIACYQCNGTGTIFCDSEGHMFYLSHTNLLTT